MDLFVFLCAVSSPTKCSFVLMMSVNVYRTDLLISQWDPGPYSPAANETVKNPIEMCTLISTFSAVRETYIMVTMCYMEILK